MIGTIFGLILLGLPFLAVGLFSDKRKGFLYVFFFLFLFETILAVFTQLLGIFYYEVIIGANFLAGLAVLFFYFKNKEKIKFNRVNWKKFDWTLLIVIAIAFLSLYQVHYNYTGKINIATDVAVGYHQAENMRYVYPYFSDEWYAVSLIKESTASHSLPLKNPFTGDFFLNMELLFHSFLAGIMLVLNLNPLTGYVAVTIISSILIIVLSYLFLRINRVSKLASAIAVLLMLYITCGANLPGLWNLVPFNFGLIFFLFLFCFISLKDMKMSVASVIAGSLFYLPLFPFFVLCFLFSLFFYENEKSRQKFLKVTAVVALILVFAIPVLYIIIMFSPLAGFMGYVLSRVFFDTLSSPFNPQYIFYYIIPFPVILLALFSLKNFYKNNKWFLGLLITGIIFWIFDAFTIKRIFIEYERIAVFTSLMFCLSAGFGFQEIGKYIGLKFKKNWFSVFNITQISTIILFLIFIPFYTQRDSWKNLVLADSIKNTKIFPKAPANQYLAGGDLEIFKNIKNKKFLSIPWKGTVIGVATENYPAVTKEGTISVGDSSIVDIFSTSNCDIKTSIATQYNLDYVYLYNFNCSNFKKISESKEGLILYEFQKN